MMYGLKYNGLACARQRLQWFTHAAFDISPVANEMETPDIDVFVRDITGLMSWEIIIRRKVKAMRTPDIILRKHGYKRKFKIV